MRINIRILIISILIGLLGLNSPTYAQKKNTTKKQLQSKQRRIERNISYTKKLLNETKNKKKLSVNQLKLLQRQVKERKRLINAYSNEIILIDNQIKLDKASIENLKLELVQLKKEYANLIYQSYKSRSQYDQWMFIIASKDFYQAMRRIRYLKEYNMYRRDKANEIFLMQQKIENEIEDYQKQKDERLGLLITKENETQELEKDRQKKKILLNKLQQKEKDLRNQLQQQQKEWNKLNKKIQEIIEAEMRKNSKGKNRLPMTPAEVQLSKDFVSNIGKLPWPMKRGAIISHFGKHNHPQLHVTIDNKGVDFQCEQSTIARAVFAGKVARIIQMAKYKAVLVKHGDYFTVYNKLGQVFVKEGDMLTTKQNIGVVMTDKESGETVLHFELWKQLQPQNPEKWIIKRR
jgi:septal ring factor EnvC (AmiA/AmiB activator)